MRCQHCENNVDLPFKCPFCGGYFCPEHRLPENHACPELWRAKVGRAPETGSRYPTVQEGTLEKEAPLSYPYMFRRAGLTSSIEIIHLAVGALMVMVIGLSMFKPELEWVFLIFSEPTILLGSALVFPIIFISHELAHKAVAKYYNLWAEFRLNLMGVLFTLMSMLPTPIKIVSPGAVMIAGAADRKVVGITALAGPITSIVVAVLFFTVHFFLKGTVASIILRGAALSAWISVLNLIPLGIMDGAKVFWWNKPIWAAVFLASAISTGGIVGNVLS